MKCEQRSGVMYEPDIVESIRPKNSLWCLMALVVSVHSDTKAGSQESSLSNTENTFKCSFKATLLNSEQPRSSLEFLLILLVVLLIHQWQTSNSFFYSKFSLIEVRFKMLGLVLPPISESNPESIPSNAVIANYMQEYSMSLSIFVQPNLPQLHHSLNGRTDRCTLQYRFMSDSETFQLLTYSPQNQRAYKRQGRTGGAMCPLYCVQAIGK